MKNYYKRTDTEQYIMIDTDNNYVVVIYSTSVVKSINMINNTETINFYITESADVTKLITVTETDFNNVKNQIISAI